MIRHCVMLRYTDDATDEERAAVPAALATLPPRIPEIVTYSYGPDLGLGADNHDFVVVADFANREDYLVYANHEAHLEVIADHIRPILAARSAVQYDVDA